MWVALLISKFAEVPDLAKTEFQGKARIIEDLYNRYLFLNKIKIPGVKKITITLFNEPGVDTVYGPVKRFSPVVNVNKSYDFELFSTLDSNEQNESILNLIQISVDKAGETFNWNLESFKWIPDEIKRLGFKNCFIVGKLKTSKDKFHRAGVEVDMQPNYALISMVFYSKDDSLLKRAELIKVHPNRLFITPFIGSTKWLNNKEFEVTNKEGEIHFIASFEDDNTEIHFTSKSKTEDQLIDELLISSVSTSKEQIIHLLKDKINKPNE